MMYAVRKGKIRMKKLLLVDYYGMCDSEGNALGHSGKVLQEYKELIASDYQVGAALSPCLIRDIMQKKQKEFVDIISLKYDIRTSNFESVSKRIKDKFKVFYNIHQVFKCSGYDIIWFYRTDFFLFFYFCFFVSNKRNRNKLPKIYVQVYQRSFREGIVGGVLGGFLDFFYYLGMKKADGVISTQKGLELDGTDILHIPDYYYDSGKYEKYRENQKISKVVCLGTMTPYKQLLPLVESFNENQMPLEIKGWFYDKEQVDKIKQVKKENILVKDEILSEEEYYRTLAEAEYAVLPYDMKQYSNRTSGVLQECLFLNTIPIAPAKMLEQNDIPGIGYQRIEELKSKEIFLNKENDSLDYNSVIEHYDKEKVRKKLLDFLDLLKYKG